MISGERQTVRFLGFSMYHFMESLVTSLRLDTHIPFCSLLVIILKLYFSLTMRNQYSRSYKTENKLTLFLILRRSRTGTVWFYTSTSNKRAARTKLYTNSLTRDLKRMYSRLTLVRISIKL